MGYSKITIGEKPVDLFFGYTAHRSLIEGARKFRDQYLTDNLGLSDYGYAKLLLAAYENYCMNKNVAPTLVFDDFMQYIDEMVHSEEATQEFGEAIKIWVASKETQKMIEQAKNTSEEKKSESLNQNLQKDLISTNTNEPVTENLG